MNSWIKKDLKYLWHPYTQMKDCEKFPPILIDRAKGIRLYDNKGKFYYDTISSWWCNVHGHNHPVINEAIIKQLESFEHIMFAGFTHKPAIQLAEKLIGITHRNLTKVFFSDNGSTAVEVALKASFQYWRNKGLNNKTKFVSLDRGYHGDTIGAMSVSGVDLFNKVFSPLFFSSYKAPSPYCYRCPVGKKKGDCDIDCVKPLERLLRKKSREISAIILEPLILAAGGMIIYPKEYLLKVSGLARSFNIHLILDEVATGFGRTGRMFACEYLEEGPDFLCLSKGITAGYLPFGATLTTEKIYRQFYADYTRRKTFYHGHTHTANAISCSAALASLKVFAKERTLENVRNLTPIFQRGLGKFNGLPFVGDTRQIGLVGALELVKDKKKKTNFGFKDRIGVKIYQFGLKERLILRPLGNVIYLFPILCVKKEELEDILERLFKVLKNFSWRA